MPRRQVTITPRTTKATNTKQSSLPRRLAARVRARQQAGSRSRQQPRKLTQNELINAESALGRTIFGPIPAGHQREFFHYRQNIWLWHESWLDGSGQRHASTVRYEVRPSGVFKRIGRSAYHKISGQELANFRRATHRYLDLIKEKLYN